MTVSGPVLEQAPPPRRKPVSAVTIILIIVGVMALVCAGVVGAGVLWVKDKADEFVAQAGDGGGFGLVMSSPEQVRAELAGAKKAYVGSWRGDQGSTLEIREGGELSYVKKSESGHTSYNLPIAGFSGDDIVCKAFLTIVIKVNEPPKEIDGGWVMVADGVKFHRQ